MSEFWEGVLFVQLVRCFFPLLPASLADQELRIYTSNVADHVGLPALAWTLGPCLRSDPPGQHKENCTIVCPGCQTSTVKHGCRLHCHLERSCMLLRPHEEAMLSLNTISSRFTTWAVASICIGSENKP
eukprot:3202017-Amphidinium_carterae.1